MNDTSYTPVSNASVASVVFAAVSLAGFAIPAFAAFAVPACVFGVIALEGHLQVRVSGAHAGHCHRAGIADDRTRDAIR